MEPENQDQNSGQQKPETSFQKPPRIMIKAARNQKVNQKARKVQDRMKNTDIRLALAKACQFLPKTCTSKAKNTTEDCN